MNQLGSMGPVLRGSVRIWNYRERKTTKTVDLFAPDGSPAQGTMDVKMLPHDPHGYGIHLACSMVTSI
jgi:hypothetical protein